MIRIILRTFSVSAMLTLLACSSGSGSSGISGGGSGSCQSVCGKMAALACPNEDPSQCVPECESELNSSPQCSSQASSYLGCIESLQFHCDADGEASIGEDALLTTCGSQAMAYAGCTACVADSNDDACDTCSKQSCCSQLKAYMSDPNVLPLSKCMETCNGESGCIQACSNQYPSVMTHYTAYSNCESSACGSVC